MNDFNQHYDETAKVGVCWECKTCPVNVSYATDGTPVSSLWCLQCQIAFGWVCASCKHHLGEHVVGSGLIDEIPTHRFMCAHIEKGVVCVCFFDRQEVIEVETIA